MKKSKLKRSRSAKRTAGSLERVVLLQLASKWAREGREMIQLAEAEPKAIGDAALRNAGGARLACARQLRSEMRKQQNDPGERIGARKS